MGGVVKKVGNTVSSGVKKVAKPFASGMDAIIPGSGNVIDSLMAGDVEQATGTQNEDFIFQNYDEQKKEAETKAEENTKKIVKEKKGRTGTILGGSVSDDASKLLKKKLLGS